MKKKVLLIDNDHNLEVLDSKSDLLRSYGFNVDSTAYLEKAAELMGTKKYSSVLFIMSPTTESTEFIPIIRKNQPGTQLVVYCTMFSDRQRQAEYYRQIRETFAVPVKELATMKQISKMLG